MDSNSSKSSLHNINTILRPTFVSKVVEGYKYALKMSHQSATAANISRKVEPGSNRLIRLDKPHKNGLFQHINMRHKYTGIADPHLSLPPGVLTVALGGAYLARLLDCICYYTFAVDGAEMVHDICRDNQHGTRHNAAKSATGSDKTIQYTGGFAGATAGNTIGSFLVPGIGPLVGAFTLGALCILYGGQLALSFFTRRKITVKKEEIKGADIN